MKHKRPSAEFYGVFLRRLRLSVIKVVLFEVQVYCWI